MDSRIMAYLRTAISQRDTERTGPFLASFDRHSDSPFRNYAIPEDGASPSAADVAALVAAYQRRGRTPRLEYIPALAPAVQAALEAAGFTIEGHVTLMSCAAGSARDLPTPSGIELVSPVSDDDLAATAAAQNEAYGAPAFATPVLCVRGRRASERPARREGDHRSCA